MEIKLAAIKRLINTGAARDVSNDASARRPLNYTNVFYSVGRNGLNGLVTRDDDTGELFAIVGRCSALFMWAY